MGPWRILWWLKKTHRIWFQRVLEVMTDHFCLSCQFMLMLIFFNFELKRKHRQSKCVCVCLHCTHTFNLSQKNNGLCAILLFVANAPWMGVKASTLNVCACTFKLASVDGWSFYCARACVPPFYLVSLWFLFYCVRDVNHMTSQNGSRSNIQIWRFFLCCYMPQPCCIKSCFCLFKQKKNTIIQLHKFLGKPLIDNSITGGITRLVTLIMSFFCQKPCLLRTGREKDF